MSVVVLAELDAWLEGTSMGVRADGFLTADCDLRAIMTGDLKEAMWKSTQKS